MSTIPIGTVLKKTHNHDAENKFYRVLWTAEKIDKIALILIPPSTPHKAARYYPSPFVNSLSEIINKQIDGTFVVAQHTPPSIVNLSDEKIRERYPTRKSTDRKRQRTDSAQIQIRDEQFDFISPILEKINQNPEEAYCQKKISQWIEEQSISKKKGRVQVRRALNKYLAMGCGKNGLLPALENCGAPKQERIQRGHKLGRKSAANTLDIIAEAGMALTPKDKDHISFGWKTYLKDGHSVRDAYLITMGTFYSNGTTIDQGRSIPKLKPPSRRPSIAQFRYWGPRSEGAIAAWKMLLRPNEWEKTYRALYGSARDTVCAVGQMASGDSTSNDVNMVSVASRLKAIGTGTVLRFHDVYSDCVVGLSFSIGAPNARLAHLAIYNAASNKVEFCRRFGLEITPYQFPSGFYRMYQYDNGELRTNRSIQLLKTFGSNAEFVRARHPEYKAVPESAHHAYHKRIDHKIAGSTHGRQRERGEQESAVTACWTYWDYMHELLRAIIYHNTKAPAHHLLTVEMRRDGVEPNRAAIHQWAIVKGYIANLPINIEQLRAHLLPKINAVVRPNGVFLLRPDRNDKRELVRNARFIGPRVVQLQWLEKARKSSTFDVQVHYDPNNLSCIWLIDEDGVHELTNQSSDATLIREGTLADVLNMQDDDCLKGLLDQEEIDQAEANFVIGRYDKNHKNRKLKKDEIKNSTEKTTKTKLKSNISNNRAREQQLIAETLDPTIYERKNVPTSTVAKTQEEATPDIIKNDAVSTKLDSLDDALAAYRARGS